jgi:hypothetical protein
MKVGTQAYFKQTRRKITSSFKNTIRKMGGRTGGF